MQLSGAHVLKEAVHLCAHWNRRYVQPVSSATESPAADLQAFEPLRDVAYFKKFTVDLELKTLVWPNGADFAPEFLHDAVRVTT